ncbi:hypothetical protein GCU56_05150 [Geodermatophilus sabuli]|uniref:LysM domain-containing protein n=1 Tax=Geodermatophilus sabuli TaxID=1564158 RepID=A0A7K3VX89_9ACTN|nr:hypothetical protein [Geodermatophilus sabuli]NEK57261.1 hypothetical protein [Geodermatophilus sabuli]
MSTRRLLVTTAAMAGTAAALVAVTPDLSWSTDTGWDLQRAAETAGAETLLLSGVAVLAWLTWAWGAVGLLLTALAALPGSTGALARTSARLVLPAGARRAAAIALGVGLAGGPLVAGCASAPPPPVTVALTSAAAERPVADWPFPATATPAPGPTAAATPTPGPAAATPAPATAAPEPAPSAAAAPAPVPSSPGGVADWPRRDPGDHVVLRGECLWEIAAGDVRSRSGAEPSDAEVARAVQAWWAANRSVIGPDPDVLLPGQVLRPPPEAAP